MSIPSANRQKELFKILKTNNIDTVRVSCFGYGDDGDIDSPEFYFSKKEALDKELTPAVKAIERELAEWAQTEIENSDVDWRNNEGGSGNWVFDIKTKTVKLRMYYAERIEHLGSTETNKVPYAKEN